MKTESDMIKYDAEYTDTFGGDANYSWVRRTSFEAPSNASDALIMRRAKRLLGLSGSRGRRSNFGDTLEFRPSGCCTVLFITAEY